MSEQQQWDPGQAQWEQPPQSPQWAGGEPTYAGWWRRVGAVFVDGLIVGIPLQILAAVLDAQGTAWFTLVSLIAGWAYYALTMGRTGENNGQTFGKQATGYRVVREDGQPVGPLWAVLREIVKSLVTVFTLLINLLWPLWDKRNQALHDKVMSDLVVRT